ncbi:hypothetical protein HMPREF1222_02133 [Treponema vincentii F0403]|uniref:Zinc-ribbon domain-containing protein n=1 Tax=Treponema vincentii F0403 TaxID=1125702 RepID=S3MC73_9SPIR|nr:zinc ribbon domain-containing protein [Treponema vincentii]EPF46609.1 hypothetical protein HMPREF1222_02133 [Treponema vincentii F0403]
METRKQEFVGTIRKCPNCGATLPGLAAVCPQCGHEITGVDAIGSVREFFNTYQYEKSERRQLNLIKNYPVPNTREDIIEFALLTAQQVKSLLSSEYLKKTMDSDTTVTDPEIAVKGVVGIFKDTLLGDKTKTIGEKSETVSNAEFLAAWKGKFEQINMKASIVFANDPKTLEHIRKIISDVLATEEKLEQSEKKRLAAENRSYAFVLIPAFLILFLGIGGLFFLGNNGESSKKQEIQRLETLEKTIIQDIENADYASAELKIIDLRWRESPLKNKANIQLWDEKRELLQKRIEDGRKKKKGK